MRCLVSQVDSLDLCENARRAAQDGDHQTARRYFTEALQLRPESIEAATGLATVCYLLRDHHAAVAGYQHALRYDPRNAGALINLGAIYNVMGRFEEAVQSLRKGISYDAKRSEGYYNLGIAYRKLGKNELAIQAYREAFRCNPGMAEALYNMANIYMDQEKYDLATTHYEQALDVNPSFQKARDALDRAKSKRSESSAAIVRETLMMEEDTATFDRPLDIPTEVLDRTLDPETDAEFLTRYHREATLAHSDCDTWAESARSLEQTVKGLGMALTGDMSAGDVDVLIARFRLAVKTFRLHGDKLVQRREELTLLHRKLATKR